MTKRSDVVRHFEEEETVGTDVHSPTLGGGGMNGVLCDLLPGLGSDCAVIFISVCPLLRVSRHWSVRHITAKIAWRERKQGQTELLMIMACGRVHKFYMPYEESACNWISNNMTRHLMNKVDNSSPRTFVRSYDKLVYTVHTISNLQLPDNPESADY